MKVKFKTKSILIAFLGVCLSMLGFRAPGVQAFLQGPATPAPQQSTTGPTPPLAVLLQDARKPADSLASLASEVTLNVPAYLWRHGCGPTAVGMVLGYYDGLGFDDLIPGSAITQTEAVNQAIASGGDISSPNPPGSEAHYEDYARPEDDPPPMITDDYFTSGRTPHPDDSIADYMHTSQSSFNNLYGWSWSYDIGPAFVAFVNQQNSSYVASYQEYFYSDGTANGTLTWSVLTGEIDAGRPMIFLVDFGRRRRDRSFYARDRLPHQPEPAIRRLGYLGCGAYPLAKFYRSGSGNTLGDHGRAGAVPEPR